MRRGRRGCPAGTDAGSDSHCSGTDSDGPGADSVADCYDVSHAVTDADGHRYAEPDADGHCHAYPDADSHAHTDCGRFRLHWGYHG